MAPPITSPRVVSSNHFSSAASGVYVPAVSVRAQLGRQQLYPTAQPQALVQTPTYASAHSWLKPLFDRAAALAGLLILSPAMLYLAYQVRKDGGPAFYGQWRVGRNGKLFRCWKFRSMHVRAKEMLDEILATNPAAREEFARDFKLKNDPRITKVGAFLRKTSLDELPQLYNVLRGEMSLVGPRPVTEPELVQYGSNRSDYVAVTPGVTGLWQVSGRNDISYAQRVALDVDYARNWSFLRDIGILLRTVKVVFRREGAY